MRMFEIACIAIAPVVLTQCSSEGPSSSARATDDLVLPYVLLFSADKSRTAPAPLDGATLPGVAYVFTSDASHTASPTGIRQVRFWLDDALRAGSPIHVEHYVPYDFAGTAADDTAQLWDTSKVASGTHSITQELTTTTGATVVTTASFRLGPATDTMHHYYVSSGGSDANDGSKSRPWATIGHADQALTLGAGGVTVHVEPGAYGGRIYTKRSGTATQPVRFLSDVRWGAKTTALWSVQGAFQEIVGFELTAPSEGGAVDCYTGLDNNTTGHHCAVIGNYIHDVGVGICASNGAVSTAVVAGHGEPTTDAGRGYNRVIGNVIRHVGADAGAPNHCNQFHGIYLSGPKDVAQNNVISGIIGWGIHARGDASGQVISNNTIFNNSHGGIILDETGPIYSVYDYATVSNNVVVNNGLAGASPVYGISVYDTTQGTHNLFSNNLLYGNVPGNWSKGETSTGGSIACADPCVDAHMQTGTDATVFVNYVSDWNHAPATSYAPTGYALRSGSPAIDRGTTSCTTGGLSPCTPSLDFLGARRTPPIDIGAFEAGAAAGTWPWF